MQVVFGSSSSSSVVLVLDFNKDNFEDENEDDDA